MVPKERLVCCHDEAEAPQISEQYPDYNVIPILPQTKITGLYERDSKVSRTISIEDLVGGATALLDLVEILRNRQFCFVLIGNEIGGYVHCSDLNDARVKLPLYLVFETLEKCLLERLAPVTETDLGEILQPGQVKRIMNHVKKLREESANPTLESMERSLSLSQILRLANHKGKLKLNPEKLENIRVFRNRVSHAGSTLVQNHEDVTKLAEAKNDCLSALNP